MLDNTGMDSLLNNLNAEQLAAVTLPAQSALILAGAGSGKTRVLTTRIAWLLKTGQVSTNSILAVTFTNKAAKEMTARLGAMVPVNLRGLWIGTFHGLCNRLLRLHWRDAALPQTFNILDAQDQLSAVKRLMKAANVDSERYPPKSLAYFINLQKEQGLRAGDIHAHDDYERQMAALYQLYEDQCQHEGVVDFAELLLRSCELLERNQPLREHYRNRFQHILVDEFQDTNDLQYRWLKLLAGKGTAVFAVGDDDQSIYAFRGANVNNMLAFQREFNVQNLIRLEQNYRSHGNILAVANALIANNQKRLGKNLHTDAGNGTPVRVLELPSDISEVEWIRDEIRHLADEGIPYREIAVLYRSNAQSRVIEHGFFSTGMPYRVYGGLRFFERAEIKHAIAYLQLVGNPDNNAAFMRAVNFPPRGIGTRTIEHLQQLAEENHCSLYAAIPLMSGRAKTLLMAFAHLIENSRAEAVHMNLPDLISAIEQQSGLEQHYQKEKEGADRLENLEQLVSAAALFLSEEGFDYHQPALTAIAMPDRDNTVDLLASPQTLFDADADLPLNMSPLSAFLSHASLEAGDAQANENADAIQLMTVHAAKGLEFEAVFITGLEEGLFPHENSASDPDGLEEERRLMYVALTRAKKRLYLSSAQTRMLHGHMRYNIASSFIDELPEENIKRLSPKKSISMDYAEWGTSSYHSHSSQNRRRDMKDLPTSPASGFPAGKNGWDIGETVYHPKFGEGVIVSFDGAQRANINFGRSGMKLLDLTIAKLEHR